MSTKFSSRKKESFVPEFERVSVDKSVNTFAKNMNELHLIKFTLVRLFLIKKCLHAKNTQKDQIYQCLLFYSFVSKTVQVWILSTKPGIHSYQFLEKQLFRSGTGWHKHCHISGQMHIDSISHVLARSCVDLAIATVWHKQHEGNLYALQPKKKNLWNVNLLKLFLTFTEEWNKLGTCRRPSKVRWMVTHLLGWAPFVVMAVMRESSSSFFSFSFLTRLSMARLAKLSLSPPCRWHMRLCTMLRHASLLVGVFVIDILLYKLQYLVEFPAVSSLLSVGVSRQI